MQTETERLRTALETILKGFTATGRWIDQITYEAIDHSDEDTAPEGYYDQDNEPEEDVLADGDGGPDMPDDLESYELDQLRLVKGVWLRPAEWEEYDQSDQSSWIETVAGICRTALKPAA